MRPRQTTAAPDVHFVQAEIDHVDTAADEVHLGDGVALGYDVLVVATGARLVPEETEGLTGAGWMEKVFTFYTPEGAAALAGALERFDGGRLVVNVVDMPIKCPVAPLEFCFLADWYFTERGIRDRVEITYVTPLDGAFTKPVASQHARRAARRQGHRARHRVQHRRGRRRRRPAAAATTAARCRSTWRWSSRCTAAPSTSAARPASATSWIRAHRRAHPAVEGRAERLRDRRRRQRAGVEGRVGHPLRGRERWWTTCAASSPGEPLEGRFDGHANCFIETGFHKALLIDFNYDTEPLPGHYPVERSALPLLKESRLNHLGKLMFQWVYWHEPAARPRHPRHRLDMPTPASNHRRTAKGGTHDHSRPSPAPTSSVNDEGFFIDPDAVDRGDGPRARRAQKASTS